MESTALCLHYISRDLKVSNKTLNALAREAYSRYPSGVISAADFMIKVGESDKDISTEQKRVHLAKLRDMLR
ncbi:hypothetical protein HZ326_27133 [Fusarium oxysporum f. sp. albedinis]|jgi:hypothetical protein|nr:hypothetical protein HZ326_27133 [Fusarium oxysporum f. sp. albedinis]